MSRSLSLNFAAVVVVSIAAASLPPPTPPPPKSTTADLLAVLGPARLSTKVNPVVARNLRSCFRFLVPFDPRSESKKWRISRRFGGEERMWSRRKREDELVWWPPEAVMELARIAFDSGGDVGRVHRALDPTMIPSRSRTLKTVRKTESGRLGILFHAKEYPAYDKEAFPYNMGYCQIGSNVPYDDKMNLRNVLWLAPLPSNSSKEWEAQGVLLVLDAHPDGIIYRDLIPEYVQYARTLYEDDFGEFVVDVNYLNVGCSGATPSYQLFIC